MFSRHLVILLCLCWVTTPLWAQVIDTRLHISIPVEKIQNARSDAKSDNRRLSDTDLALRLALPILWDHIVPLNERFQADAIRPNYGLVTRIIPDKKQVNIEFNGPAVFRALKIHHIPAIVMTPRFHLTLHVHNSTGLEMTQTQALLMQEAKQFAPEWGIGLTDAAPSVVIAWKWLGNQEVMLSLRGNSRLQEFSETRTIAGVDPLPALKEWLRNILLEARDAYTFNADSPGSTHISNVPAMQQVILTIDRKTSLMAQMALEDALASDPRIQRVLPVSLGVTRQRYQLSLEGEDSSWLPEWFARRGYRLTALPGGGWVAQ